VSQRIMLVTFTLWHSNTNLNHICWPCA